MRPEAGIDPSKLGSMSGCRTHFGKIAVYDADHVDTDRIIPARFLSMVTRSGYGDLLFKDVRGPEFPLDQAAAAGATILVVGTNFGCGSSREHAVWAIQQAGFQVVISRVDSDSPGYSDIFRQNAANCGLLLVELPAEHHVMLTKAGSGAFTQVDLENQKVTVGDDSVSFEINPATRAQLLAGHDLIGTTLVHSAKIEAFERERDSFRSSPRSGVSS